MDIRTYHDFIILTEDVEKDDGGGIKSFSLRVFDSPVGQGEKKQVPIPDYVPLRDQVKALAKRAFDQDEAGLIGLGSRLGELLLPPHARDLYRRSLDRVKEDGLRLRLRLEPELADLPWEYMHVQDAPGEPTSSGFLALDPRISIVRHEALPIPPEWSPPGDERRVVVAMATPEPYGQYPKLDYLPEEQRRIKQALSNVPGVEDHYVPDYDQATIPGALPSATIDKVDAALQPSADIFQFSGHGDFEEDLGPELGTVQGEGWIVLAGDNNQAVRVPAERLAEIVRGRGVRLVVLSACKTAQRDRYHMWSSTVASLLKGRIPCVVAMQFTVYDDLAAAFIASFYQTLVDERREVDEAVSQGRAAMRNRALLGRPYARDWGAPVLYSRVPGGHLFHAVKDEDAREQAHRISSQRSSLQQAWWGWTAKEALASRSQLEHLERAGEEVELSPPQVLLLLRSAVVEDASVAPWLDRLRREGGDLLIPLDDPGASQPAAPAEVQTILGLDHPALPDRPRDVGRVAWSAVRHPDLVTRQTATLALATLQPAPDEGLKRLGQALQEGHAPGRQAELLGTLADADAENAARYTRHLSAPGRAGVWLWRVRRRLQRDGRRIGMLTLGGALGAGLGLGALRALIAVLTGDLLWGVQFAMYSYWGGLVGLALCLGLLLAEPLLLQTPVGAGQAPPAHARWSRPLVAVGLGTLFFGLGHGLQAWLVGFSPAMAPLVLPLGFLFGLGLSIAVHDQPLAGWRWGSGCWLLRVGTAMLAGVLVQAIFDVARDKGVGLTIAWSGVFYESHFADSVERWWPGLATQFPRWPAYLGLLDAALVGAVLTIGIALGLSLSAARLKKKSDQAV